MLTLLTMCYYRDTRHTIYQRKNNSKKKILTIVKEKKAKTCEWDILENKLVKETQKYSFEQVKFSEALKSRRGELVKPSRRLTFGVRP